MNAQKHRGFTALEIMATTVIIAIVLALLLPTLTMLRGNATSAICVSNLRTISTGMSAYQSDNNGYFPPVYITATDNWWFRLNPYLGSPVGNEGRKRAGWACPAVMEQFHEYSRRTIVYYSYGMNYVMGNAPAPIKVNAVRQPSKVILAGDTGFNASTTLAKLDASAWRGYHRGCNNLLFVDGHIQSWRITPTSSPYLAPYKAGGTQDMWTP